MAICGGEFRRPVTWSCVMYLDPRQDRTRIVVMSEVRSLAWVKAHLSEVADLVEGQQERVVVTRNGKPAAVIVSPDDLEGLEETLAIMSDPALMRDIREGRKAAAKGDVHELETLKKRLDFGG